MSLLSRQKKNNLNKKKKNSEQEKNTSCRKQGIVTRSTIKIQ